MPDTQHVPDQKIIDNATAQTVPDAPEGAAKAPSVTADVATVDADKMFMDPLRRLIDRMDRQVLLIGNDTAGTAPVFYDDAVFNIALPWASFEEYQFRILSRHAVPEPVFYTQLFDLLPSLTGKIMIDVGSYTGLQAMVMRHVMTPTHVVMIEPQNVMQPLLARTIAANPDGCPVTLLQLVIDDGTQGMVRSGTQPGKLHDTSYLRREGAALASHTLDSLDLGAVGLINLDIPGPKIYALRGAQTMLRNHRPAVVVNVAGRDVNEMREFMTTLDYEFVRLGERFAMFLPA